MLIEKIHRVAWRCKEAKQTVEFYNRIAHLVPGDRADRFHTKISEIARS